jgi:ATP-dependent exoDNAse (exonuclease V) beta subunit
MEKTSAPFIIYKSSAGSGKTYTLTMEYLKLALSYPDAFRSILAVTFTNKATQEMKERILKELKRMRKGIDGKEYMDKVLMESLELDTQGLQVRAAQTLTAILHDYGRFSVNTIDSFFQKVVRAFAREMDLNAKFEVEMDQDAVLDRVVDRVVEKVMEDEQLHEWLVDYAKEEIEKGNSWDIRKKIKELGKELFQENFKKFAPEIRVFLKERDNISQLQQFTRERKAELFKITRSLRDEAERIRKANGLEWTDFSGGTRSFALKFAKLGDREQPVPELTDNQMARAYSEEGWFAKSSKQKDAIITAYHQGLGEILGKIPELYVKWMTLTAISRNIFVFGVFRNLLEELTVLKNEENMLLISDANEFLKEITRENEAPFIYEKVGNQFRHYLIDEFQDTSGFQWASFRPLLENSLAQGNTNLLVGDVKQSIYRWRGGEMRLLLEEVEQEIGKQYIENRNLDTNYRSLPNVIQFNNALFKKLPQSFEDALALSHVEEEGHILSKAYQDVFQHVSPAKQKSAFKGKVRLEFLEEDKNQETGKFKEMVLEKLPEMVMALQDREYALKDIAFLVRTKNEGALIADCMMEFAAAHPETKYRFDVLSDESMFLYKSASVKALVAGLKYLHSPDDLVQFKTMWYYRSVLQNEKVDHDLFAMDKIPVYLEEKVVEFKRTEAQLLQLPLMETVEELIGFLGLQEDGLELAYISGFKEAVYDFSVNNRADLAGFLEWWEEHKDKRTVRIPESHNAMRIMTIHKSKGLQFKVVLMPFLDWKIFDTSKSNVVWAPFEDKESKFSAIIPISLNKDLAKSEFTSIYEEEKILAYLDSLNMVYVALTRAEEIFWSLSPFTTKATDGSNNQLAYHLQMVLSSSYVQEMGFDFTKDFDPEGKVYDFGDWPEKVDSKSEIAAPVPLRWAYQNWYSLLKVKQYAVDFSKEGLAQRKRRDFGLLVHELLEKSKSREDAKNQIRVFYYEGRLDREELMEVEAQLDRLFEDALFASWFETGNILLTEQGILLPGGKQKRPDRIILKDQEAIVVDFKTGEEYERYGKQVLEYMDLVKQLSGKPVKGYLCYLETGKIKEVGE